MADIPPISDDEIVLRHVPGGTTFQAAGPGLTTANFRPRTAKGETAISIGRLQFNSTDQLLTLTGGDRAKGSRVAWARVDDIRKFGFVVTPDPILPDNPGHALIESGPVSDLRVLSEQRKLAVLFQFEDIVPIPPPPGAA